jgi:hypothetical protein
MKPMCSTRMTATTPTTIDLFLQDFVTSHRILNQRCTWTALTSRRFLESGAGRKVFHFRSGEADHYAVGTLLDLPDGDCYRFELVHPATRGLGAEEHRFDCLRMMSADTHNGLTVSRPEGQEGTLVIQLTTRNRGLMNVAFVVRDGLTLSAPILVA